MCIMFGALAIGAMSFTSCKKCKDCEIEETVYMDGVLISESETSPQEFCKDDLKRIEKNPEVTETVNIDNGWFEYEQKIVTRYTCR